MTLRRPMFIPRRALQIGIVSEPIADDVVYRESRGKILYWSFYDEYLRNQEDACVSIRIPVERTSKQADPVDYWQHILKGYDEDCSVCISLQAKSAAAAKLLPGIDPYWHSLGVWYNGGQPDDGFVQYSSVSNHLYSFGWEDETKLTKIKKYYEEILQDQYCVFFSGPVSSSTTLTNEQLAAIIEERFDEDCVASFINGGDFDKLNVTFWERDGSSRSIQQKKGLYFVCYGTKKIVTEFLELVQNNVDAEQSEIKWCKEEEEFAIDSDDSDEELTDMLPLEKTLNLSLSLRPALHMEFRWKFQHAVLLNICIGFAQMKLPAYVILWISDFIEFLELQSHYKKIRLIENVRDSIRKVYRQRLSLADGPVSRRTRSTRYLSMVGKEDL